MHGFSQENVQSSLGIRCDLDISTAFTGKCSKKLQNQAEIGKKYSFSKANVQSSFEIRCGLDIKYSFHREMFQTPPASGAVWK